MVSIETLRALPCFAGVPTDSLRTVADIAEEHPLKAGQILWRQGEPVHWLCVVRHGEVDVIYELRAGKECVVDTVVAGELTGWSALVEPHQHTATCVARQDGQVLCIEAAGIRTLCEGDFQLAYHLLMEVARTLSSRLEGARLQLAAAG